MSVMMSGAAEQQSDKERERTGSIEGVWWLLTTNVDFIAGMK
jgi:hypothetical protein